LRARHDYIMGLPLRRCRAVDWDGRHGRSIEGEPSPHEIHAVRRKLAEMEQVILRHAGPQGLSSLEHTCLEDGEPQNPFLLKRCLGILSRLRYGGRATAT
jgi:hypothetical protein